MNLRQLRYVVALAETQSFTKAAGIEYVVQSALSQQIRKLEDELGVALFERTTRSVALSPAGEALLPLMHRCWPASTSSGSMRRRSAAPSPAV